MNTDLLIIILLVVLAIILLILCALVIFILFKTDLLKKSQSDEEIKISKHNKSVVEAYACAFHPDQNAVATCAICEDAVCEHCHKDWDGIHLCPEHFALYGLHTWIEVAEIKTTPTAPEKGHKLYHFKHKLWSDERVPAYLVTHYKIDVDGDYIESWVKLYAREEEADHLMTRFRVIANH